MIHDIEEYRKVSESLYHILKPQGIRTLVTGPIEVNGKYIGFYGVDNPPVELMDNISTMINMMEFVISMMIRIRNYAREVEEMRCVTSLPAAGAEKHCRLPMMETLPKISRLPSLCVI